MTSPTGEQLSEGVVDDTAASALLEMFLAIMPDAALVIDGRGTISLANAQAEALFEYDAGSLVGQPVEVLVPERFRRGHQREREQYLVAPAPRAMGAGRDLMGRRADGTEFAVDISLAAITSAEEPLIVAAVRDTSEIRVAHDTLLLAGDRERIARDLHDVVIQRLFGTGMAIQSALQLIGDSPAAARLQRAVDELDRTITDIRNAIFALGPPITRGTGPRALILHLAASMSPVLGFEPTVQFSGPIDSALPDDLVVKVMAVAREALSNIERHADATRAEIELAAETDLVLRIVDDGVGIGDTAPGGGLTRCFEVVEELGGTLTFGTPDGGGTALELRIPVQA